MWEVWAEVAVRPPAGSCRYVVPTSTLGVSACVASYPSCHDRLLRTRTAARRSVGADRTGDSAWDHKRALLG
jgi:hypothetical protein